MTSLIDLSPNYLATVERILAEHVPECEVRAFGSRAMWTAKDYSDLDLAVVGKGPLDWRKLGRLKEAFEESTLPMRVDVLDWHSISEGFRDVIEQGYVVVQESAKQATAGEWREVALGEVLTLQRGFDLPTTQRKPGSYPVIASTGPVGTHGEAMVRGPGVVIGRSGSLGGGQFIEHDFWPLNTTLWVKDFKGNDPRFCYYLLKSLDLAQFNVGSGVPTLNRNHIHPLPVPLAPLPEQRAIAHILGTLDDKIELNHRMNETLEEMARALFKSWFVDFDPVRAKMEARDTGLPQDVAALFPDRLVESELGEIPEGWEVRALGEVVKQLRGSENPQSSPSATFSHFSIPAFDQGKVPIREYGASIKSAKTYVWPGVVLMSKLNPEIERVWLVDVEPGERAVCSTEFLVLQAHPPLQRSYIYCLARSPLFREQLESLVTGTSKSHQRAQPAAIQALQVVLPSEPVIHAFDRRASEFLTASLSQRREATILAAQRDVLLPRLVSGEMRIEEARSEARPTT